MTRGGLAFIAGQAFQKADIRRGVELWERGLKEMDRAVELEPDNVGVRIPRGAALLTASRFVQDKAAQHALLEKGIGDNEKVLEVQKPYIRPVTNALVRETSATSSNVVFSPVVARPLEHWLVIILVPSVRHVAARLLFNRAH